MFKPGHYAIVMEYCAGGSLRDVVMDSSRELTLTWKLQTLVGVASGLAYLHEKKPLMVVHGDLKARNILLATGDIPKLCDFGLAKARSETSATTAKGAANLGSTSLTLAWSAPELLVATRPRVTPQTDIYALAMTIYEVFAREAPFAGVKDAQLFQLVTMRQARPDIPDDTPALVADLITESWSDTARDRPTAAEVCRRLGRALQAAA